MAVEFCSVCNKKHKATSWRTYAESGRLIHICDKYFKPVSVEHVPQSTKTDREKYAKSLLQPWREGTPSAEFIEAYPKQAAKMFTLKEKLKAKEVWKDSPNHKNWRKSK